MDKRTRELMFSSKNDIWATPLEIYDKYKRWGYFDPCPINPKEDGLSIDWKKLNFVNPPYSDLSNWIDKSLIEVHKRNKVVLLVPCRTDTKWFHKILSDSAVVVHIEFIKGRLKFGEICTRELLDREYNNVFRKKKRKSMRISKKDLNSIVYLDSAPFPSILITLEMGITNYRYFGSVDKTGGMIFGTHGIN